jgi:flagellar hook-associated protein 3 FlgL
VDGLRVSNYQKFDMSLFNMNQIQSKQATLSTQVSTGKEFQKMSESPIKASQSLIIRNSLNQVDQYLKNVSDAKGILSAVETNMSSVVSILDQAREQGLKASSSTYSQENRDSFAKVLDQNIEQLVNISNSKFLGKHLFAGEKTQVKPFDYDGTTVTYNGDAKAPSISTSSNSTIKVSESGDLTFSGVFDAMIQLKDSVASGNIPNIEDAIRNLDIEMSDFVDLRSDIGVRMQSMEMYTKTYESDKMNLQIQQTDVEEVDFTEKFMEHSNMQMMHQGLLATTQKMFSISLLNYM